MVREKQTARKSTTHVQQRDRSQSTDAVLRVRPLSSPNITSEPSSTVPGTSKPKNIYGPIAKAYLSARRKYSRLIKERTYGVGTGKGGIKRLAEVMRPRRIVEPRRIVLSHFRRYQRQQEYSIPLVHITRIIKELLLDMCRDQQYWRSGPPKVQMAAITAIRDAAEGHLVNFFELCSFLTNHGRRVTLLPKDLALASRLKHWAASSDRSQ